MSSKHTSCYVTFIWCGCSRMPYPLQVLIWWGDFPCSRAKMSRRSVTLEELSSSAWARLRSYDPASKSAVHLFHLFLRASADKPVHEHAAWSFRSLKMFYWERVKHAVKFCRFSSFLEACVDGLSVSMSYLNKEDGRETENPRLFGLWTLTQHVSAVQCV